MNATAKHAAQRLGAGRYLYRGYLIEDVSGDNDTGRRQWNITQALPGQAPCDAAETLGQAKAMIDIWFEQVSIKE